MTRAFDPLFQPLRLGALTLKNRLVMAPMTRSRADDGVVVGELTARYYAQRAGAGLILTEGVFPSAMGKGYVRTPGLAEAEHVRAWRRVTDAVHAEGGLIAAQLMHVGRISDPSFLPGGATPVAPSAVRPNGASYTDAGLVPHPTPRALTEAEILETIGDFGRAAERALEAGFDGVELHAGSGYLPMQFLSSGANRRDDAWGGGLGNRLRFTLETLKAMVAVVGADRVGLRLTPEMPFNDVTDADPAETYEALVEAVASLGIAYLDVGVFGDKVRHDRLRARWTGAYLRGVGLTAAAAAGLIADGEADAVVFGQAFLANPDLPERLRLGAALNAPDPATFYAGGALGYVDYPALSEAA